MTNRPLSPHLQTYRLPMLAVVSILNRVAGVALALGLIVLSIWIIALGSGETAYISITSILISPLGMVALIGWTFALTWHGGNGIRHLIWDMGYGFELHAAERSAYFVIGFSLLTTALIWAWIWTAL